MKSTLYFALITIVFATSGCAQNSGSTQPVDPIEQLRDASIFGNIEYLQNQDTFEKWLIDGKANATTYETNEKRIMRYARAQLGVPYVAGLLETPEQESLVVTLEGSDCVLFVEHSLALALTERSGSTDYDDLARNIAILRYHDGIIDGYASRQHYFSDWLRSNEQKGILEILHQNDETLPHMTPVTFMSENRSAYRQLADSDSLFALIVAREKYLNALTPLKFIPQDRIPEFEKEFRTGDVLSFVSTIGGLDIAHTGIVYVDPSSRKVGFYHASTTGEVIKDPKTIFEYTRDRRNVNGVIIARVK
jgi:hypothetical protein